MMNKFYIFLIFILYACSPITLNTPYIDVQETIKLKTGMDRIEVLKTMGEKPIYVEYGNSNEIIWIYEVRDYFIDSKINLNGTITLVKKGPKSKTGSPIHHLRLRFINNALISWTPTDVMPESIMDELIAKQYSSKSPLYGFLSTFGYIMGSYFILLMLTSMA